MLEFAAHVISLAGTLFAACLSLYVSNRLMKNKEETIAEVRAVCASQESFDTHEEADIDRFAKTESQAQIRHKELREDISKVEGRLDAFIRSRT